MDIIFEIIDKTGRKIHLTKERWNDHIKPEHPDITDSEEIKETILHPDKIVEQSEYKCCYYKFFKHKKSKLRYLKVIVNYINQHGFVITAHFVANIRIR